MGRPGRYTLSVMAWVAAYAGWSSIIGLVVAALTGEEAREVSSAWSALLTVVGPLVPTLVALWFNDWARDGFPTREQMRARRKAAPAASAASAAGVPVSPAAPAAPAAPTEQAPPVVARATVADATIPPATVAGATIREAHPLGVPAATGAAIPAGAATAATGAAAGEAGMSAGGFPVAPLVRD